jgi:hypothetical protein
MQATLVKIRHEKDGKASQRYGILCGPEWNSDQELVVLDVTRELETEIRQDQAHEHVMETGPRFGSAVYRAISAGSAHAEVTERWRQARGHENVRPRIGHPGSWRIYRSEATQVLREWRLDD